MDPNRLKEIPIFSELSPEEAKRLAAFATETSIAEGQMLMKQGDYSTELIAIEEGTADVLRDGEKVASLKPGDLIGEMGLLERRPRNADVIATSPMRVIKLTHWEIRRMSQDTIERIEKIVSQRSAGRRGRPGAHSGWVRRRPSHRPRRPAASGVASAAGRQVGAALEHALERVPPRAGRTGCPRSAGVRPAPPPRSSPAR